jgi:hypothetical protein
VQTCKEQQELRYAFGPCTGEVLPSEQNGACVATPDAGPPDSGPPDSGPPDAGPTRHGMVVYGGTDAQVHDLDETWMFDGSAWEQIHTPGPGARSGAMAATLGGKVVLFGGKVSGKAVDDTWTFDGSTWKQLSVKGPPARFWGLLTPWNGKLLLFGGVDGQANKDYGDTWLFDGASWTQVAATGRGGVPDEWLFDGTAWTPISATGPTYRFGGVSLPFGGQALIAGGCKIDGDCVTHYTDTWTFDGSSWSMRASSLGNALWDAMATNSTSNCGAALSDSKVGIVGHGIKAGVPDFAQVIVFDGNTWAHPDVPNPPTYRWGCTAASL